MYNLQNKVALVTGAGGERGLGRAIAMRLAEEGADVAVNDIAMQPRESSGWGDWRKSFVKLKRWINAHWVLWPMLATLCRCSR